jgi:hypothetical protein
MNVVITFNPAGLNSIESGNDAIVFMFPGKLVLLPQEYINRQKNIRHL